MEDRSGGATDVVKGHQNEGGFISTIQCHLLSPSCPFDVMMTI
jgi:hypothetical protein